jgi:hypothetical protein
MLISNTKDMLPKKIYLNYVDENDKDKTWSEEPISVYDCKMQNREYTDLSQLWHDVSEEPKIGSNIVAIDKGGEWWDIQPYEGNNDGYGLRGWSYFKQWAYISDLLPKE